MVMVFGKALYTLGTILVAAAVTIRSYPFMVVGRIVAAFGDITTEIAEYKMFSSWFAPSQGFALLVALRHASAKVPPLTFFTRISIIEKYRPAPLLEKGPQISLPRYVTDGLGGNQH